MLDPAPFMRLRILLISAVAPSGLEAHTGGSAYSGYRVCRRQMLGQASNKHSLKQQLEQESAMRAGARELMQCLA